MKTNVLVKPETLAVVVIFLTLGQIHQNNAATDVQRQQCTANNTARAQDRGLWDYILGAPGPPKTAQQKAEAAHLKSLVAQKDTPRDCAALYPG